MVLTVSAELSLGQFSMSAWLVLSTRFSSNDLQVPYTLGYTDALSRLVTILLTVGASIPSHVLPHGGLHIPNGSVHLLLPLPHLTSNNCAYTNHRVRTCPQVPGRPGVPRTGLPGGRTAASTANSSPKAPAPRRSHPGHADTRYWAVCPLYIAAGVWEISTNL